MPPLFHYLVGSGYNHLARAAVAPVAGAADVVNGDVEALRDGTLEAPFLFGGAAGTSHLSLDLNQVTNGGFEAAFAGGLPAAATANATWRNLTGAGVTRVTADPYEGAASLVVDGGVGKSLDFDLRASAGEALNFQLAYRVVPTELDVVSAAELRVQNQQTSRWLNVAREWQAAETFCARTSSEAWQFVTGRFAVEDFAACQSDRPILRFQLRCMLVDGTAQFDAFYVWPRITFASVHGHNVPPGVACGVRSGPTSSTPNLRALIAVAQPSMWATFPPVDERYWTWAATTPPDLRQIVLRELVLGQARTLLRQREDGAEETLIDPQDRTESDLGPLQAHLRTEHGRRRLAVRLKFPSDSEMAEWREIMARSRNGAYPLVIVPDSLQPDGAMLCRVPPEWTRAHKIGTFYESGAEFEELPFPSMVS